MGKGDRVHCSKLYNVKTFHWQRLTNIMPIVKSQGSIVWMDMDKWKVVEITLASWHAGRQAGLRSRLCLESAGQVLGGTRLGVHLLRIGESSICWDSRRSVEKLQKLWDTKRYYEKTLTLYRQQQQLWWRGKDQTRGLQRRGCDHCMVEKKYLIRCPKYFLKKNVWGLKYLN